MYTLNIKCCIQIPGGTKRQGKTVWTTKLLWWYLPYLLLFLCLLCSYCRMHTKWLMVTCQSLFVFWEHFSIFSTSWYSDTKTCGPTQSTWSCSPSRWLTSCWWWSTSPSLFTWTFMMLKEETRRKRYLKERYWITPEKTLLSNHPGPSLGKTFTFFILTHHVLQM